MRLEPGHPTRRARTRPPSALVAAAAAALLVAGCGEEVAPRHKVAGGDAGRGREAVMRHGCASCHTIPGVPRGTGIVGPTLDGFAGRVYIGGSIPNYPGNLIAWLMDPPALKPGTAMPDLHVPERDARDMAAFLYTLGPAASPFPPVERRASVPRAEREAMEARDARRLAGIEAAMARVTDLLSSGRAGAPGQHPGE